MSPIRRLQLLASAVAVLAITLAGVRVLLQPPSGTLLLMASAQSTDHLDLSTLSLHSSTGWHQLPILAAVPVVPAASRTVDLERVAIPAGRYDAARVGGRVHSVDIEVEQDVLQPLLLAVAGGSVVALYGGSQGVSLGLSELSGQLRPLPDFNLVDQDGRSFTKASLAGRDVILAAFHTTCHQTCPLYTGLFLQMEPRLPATARLVEVSTDPDADTPPVLRDYAGRVGIGWTLATGDREALAAFWQPLGSELSGADSHTSELVLIDRYGYVRSTYQGVPDVGRLSPELMSGLDAAGRRELSSHGNGWGQSQVLGTLAAVNSLSASVPAEGAPVPDFQLPLSSGGRIRPGSYLGRPLVISFWATWCQPCRQDLSLLAAAASKDGRVAVLLVDEREQPAQVSSFLRALQVPLPTAYDGEGTVARGYGVAVLPVTVFVRPDGTIASRHQGQLDAGGLGQALAAVTAD